MHMLSRLHFQRRRCSITANHRWKSLTRVKINDGDCPTGNHNSHKTIQRLSPKVLIHRKRETIFSQTHRRELYWAWIRSHSVQNWRGASFVELAAVGSKAFCLFISLSRYEQRLYCGRERQVNDNSDWEKRRKKKLADVARLTSKRVSGMGEEVRGLAFRRQTSLFVLRTVQNRIS